MLVKTRWTRGVLFAALAVLMLTAVAAWAGATSAQGDPPSQADFGLSHRPVCGPEVTGSARCHSDVVDQGKGAPNATTPTGLSPQTIKSVYGFPTAMTAGALKTIVIVDAYDAPNIENDLNVFSGKYGLPACTTQNLCFQKLDQRGGTRYPRADAGWALEISLDVEWAHAIAPGAKIVLVEADSNSYVNLFAGVDQARSRGQYVSMSWGGSEFSGEAAYDSHFGGGVSFFVSAGDTGTPAEYPSASPNVVSVGGTTLTFSGSLFVSETGWRSGGGGCSQYETASSAQTSFGGYASVGCTGKRATPDVALDADPASGVAVYDSTKYLGSSGWFTVGGTSASTPMWAARAAGAGVAVNASYVYSGAITYRDITSGNNGAACAVGYDLCTGRGSWTGATP
jgi:subtilase family serine protease